MLPEHGPRRGWLLAAAEGFAYLGGAIFVVIAILSVGSIVSRALWSRPLQGDYELVQLGGAVFVSLCLPITQMRTANIIVDFFTVRSAPAKRAWLDAAGALLLALVMTLLAWRLSAGTLAMREAGETTTILGWPLWIAYAAMVPGIALTALAALSNALDHVRKALR
ncbi:MAG TPA: TRAP transporter small permease subunit [Casimicrobiaceae bacterium]|jgi:TRAP-type C4-dicarboxylate transport system permease small subunit|nr:TRAP transporter small permease subunit [Casimicrobiaceae bacterium]